MPGERWQIPELPSALDDDAPGAGPSPGPAPALPGPFGFTHLFRRGETIRLSTQPRRIDPLESFEVTVPATPIPCARCGVDLAGGPVFLVDPFVNDRGERAYKPACEACTRE